MTPLSLHCAECGAGIPLYLTENPKSLFLTCPVCRAGLLYADGKTHSIAREDVEQWKNTGAVKTFGDLIHLLNARSAEPKEGRLSPFTPEKVKRPSTRSSAVRDQASVITQDDVVNLVIDLNTSASVDDFLKKM